MQNDEGKMRSRKLLEPILLDGIHSTGKSIASHKGKKYYIEYGIPGETVKVELDTRKKGFYGGSVSEIIQPSDNRIIPFCKHFGQCGGCNWQHIDYNLQLKLKREILMNAFQKYSIISPEIPAVIPSPETQFFRHRVEYSFVADGWTEQQHSNEGSIPVMGFHLAGAPNQVINIDECNLQSEPSREICDAIRTFVLKNKIPFYDHQENSGFLRSLSIRIALSGDIMLILGLVKEDTRLLDALTTFIKSQFPQIISLCYTIHTSEKHSQLQGIIIPLDDSGGFIYEHLNGFSLRIYANSFFQPNGLQASNIYKLIREWAGLTGRERVIDLYTGIGIIALFLASSAKEVLGIEGSSSSIEDARENARLNGIKNVEFMVGDILQTFNLNFLSQYGKPDLIVLDPPRSGTLIEIKKTILASGAEKILYLSCNPVSLAFDLKQLCEGYKIARIQPFDMLPHTSHLETLVLLEKNSM
jgi:23S rRNA (uracil1939-C5)-methyltransferase